MKIIYTILISFFLIVFIVQCKPSQIGGTESGNPTVNSPEPSFEPDDSDASDSSDTSSSSGSTDSADSDASFRIFETYLQGSSSATGISENYQILETQNELDDLLETLGTSVDSDPDTEVDFENNIIVAALLGTKSSGGYSIEISNATIENQVLTITVTKTTPGENCMTTQALNTPYHLILISRKLLPEDYTLEVNKTTTTEDCE